MPIVVYGQGMIFEYVASVFSTPAYIVNPDTFPEDSSAIISVQGTKVFTADELRQVNGMAWNLHNAKLPEYRGFHTIGHAIFNKEKKYTTTVHWITPKIDQGDIAFQSTVPVFEDDTAQTLYFRSANRGVMVLFLLLDCVFSQTDIPIIPQVGIPRYYKRHEIEYVRRIPDGCTDQEEICRRARACWIPPHEAAYFYRDGMKYHVSPTKYEIG